MLVSRPTIALPLEDVPSMLPQTKLTFLRVQHDDLDAAIGALLESGKCDDLLITRLKKRKLQIKDEIASLLAAHQPAPDRIACAS